MHRYNHVSTCAFSKHEHGDIIAFFLVSVSKKCNYEGGRQ